MERSLHRQLKERYGVEKGGRSEVVMGDFRIDALGPDGRLIEIQSSPLGLLKRKLGTLLPSAEIAVIKPIVVARRLIRRDQAEGADISSRRSPRRGELVEIFEEFVGLVRLFPHPNLRIELLAVDVDEIRVTRGRRPGYLVVDRILREVIETVRLAEASDLWSLLPAGLPDQFTTEDLARVLAKPVRFAQQVTYTLLHTGAAKVVGKCGNRRIYSRSEVEFPHPASLVGNRLSAIPRRVR